MVWLANGTNELQSNCKGAGEPPGWSGAGGVIYALPPNHSNLEDAYPNHVEMLLIMDIEDIELWFI